MAFDVSALSNYTKDNVDSLIAKSHFSGQGYEYLRSKGAKVQTGIKTAENIHLIAEDIVFQADSGCGFNASGGSTISKRAITVGSIKVNKAYCPKDLKAKATQALLKPGSMAEGDDDAAWASAVAEENAKVIAEALDKAWFQGDTTFYDVNLKQFDGLIKNTVSGSVAANTTALMGTAATAFTAANIIACVDAVWQSFPEAVKGKEDAVILLGTDLFDKWILALKTANLFHFDPKEASNYEMTIPGTTYKVKGLSAMSGSNKIIGLRASNVYFGVDLEHEEEEFSMKYNDTDENVRFKAAFKAGVNVAYPSEVVRFDLA